MPFYAIIETDEGFAVVEVPTGGSAEDAAKTAGGVLIDEGPFKSYEEAREALATLPNPYERDV